MIVEVAAFTLGTRHDWGVSLLTMNSHGSNPGRDDEKNCSPNSLNSVAELCGWALWLGSMSRPCPPVVLCGWALFCVQPLSSSCPLWALCPGLVFIFCWALSSFCPLGRAPEELCGWALWPVAAPLNFVARVAGEECGSDVNADKNSLMKRVKVGRTNFF